VTTQLQLINIIIIIIVIIIIIYYYILCWRQYKMYEMCRKNMRDFMVPPWCK